MLAGASLGLLMGYWINGFSSAKSRFSAVVSEDALVVLKGESDPLEPGGLGSGGDGWDGGDCSLLG